LLLIPPKLPTGFVEKISQAYNGIEIVHRPISEYKLEASLRIISSLKSSSKENPTDKSQYSVCLLESSSICYRIFVDLMRKIFDEYSERKRISAKFTRS
jgi:hypothetical protein